MKLKILDSTFSVMKFPPTETIPLWALNCHVFSITRTDEELSSYVLPNVYQLMSNLRKLKMIGSV